MAEDLARDELRDRVDADDDGVLHVGGPRAGERPGADARERDERDREYPEREQLGRVRLREPRHPRGREEEERPDRHEVEDADEIVERGMTRALLVAIVEAVQPSQHDPAGKRHEEEWDLAAVLDRVVGPDGGPEEEDG